MKLNLSNVIALAEAGWAALSGHDQTGVLANPNSSLSDQLKAVGPAVEHAGESIVETSLPLVLGPAGAAVADAAIPLLDSIIEAATAKKASLQPTTA